MKKLSRWLAVALSAALAMSALTITALAEETRSRLTRVYLNVSTDIVPGTGNGTVLVDTSDAGFQVSSVEVVNKPAVWADNDTPTVHVTLTANEDYYFPNANKSVFELSGKEASYVDSKIEGDNKSQMILTIQLGAISDTGLVIPTASWDANGFVAHWDTTFGAKKYQIRLFRGEDTVGSLITTAENSYDFSSMVEKSGGYTFQVRAEDASYKRGPWTVSDKRVADITQTTKSAVASATTLNGEPGFVPQGQWRQNETGWWYENNDGTFPKDNWLFIEQKWYYFDANGYMKTGWVSSGNKWYYCDANGVMLTNATTPDGFYVNADGVQTEVR